MAEIPSTTRVMAEASSMEELAAIWMRTKAATRYHPRPITTRLADADVGLCASLNRRGHGSRGRGRGRLHLDGVVAPGIHLSLGIDYPEGFDEALARDPPLGMRIGEVDGQRRLASGGIDVNVLGEVLPGHRVAERFHEDDRHDRPGQIERRPALTEERARFIPVLAGSPLEC